MPAKSKAQQRFFGMVDAYKKGELDNASEAIKDAADGMSTKEVKKFARTKHDGLPNHVKKEKKNESFTITMSDIKTMVMEVLDRTVSGPFYGDDDYVVDTESLGSDIARSIMIANGSKGRNLYSDIYDFSTVRDVLENQYKFKYVGPDENRESHDFVKDNIMVSIFPTDFYPRLGRFKFYNFHVFRD